MIYKMPINGICDNYKKIKKKFKTKLIIKITIIYKDIKIERVEIEYVNTCIYVSLVFLFATNYYHK